MWIADRITTAKTFGVPTKEEILNSAVKHELYLKNSSRIYRKVDPLVSLQIRKRNLNA